MSAKSRMGSMLSGMRLDSFANLLTGVGIAGKDARVGMTVAGANTIDAGSLTSLFRGDGFANRIVNQMVEDSTRKGFTIDGDEERKVLARLEELQFLKHLAEWLRWGRLYGGSVMVIGVSDGSSTFEAPIGEKSKNIIFFKVYSKEQVQILTYYTDTTSPKYGLVETYNVQPIGGNAFVLHESRCVVYDGEPVSDDVRKSNRGWGDSILQSCYERIRALTNVYDHSELLVKDYSQSVIQISNLMELLAAGKEDVIRKRLNILDLSRNILNSMLIDKTETYSRSSSSVAGIPELINAFAEGLSGASCLPLNLLLGRQQQGMGAEDNSSTRSWYDKVNAYQTERLLPAIEYIVSILFIASEVGANSLETDWKICFVPLWQPSAKEIADVKKVEAETVAIYIQNEILTPEEVSESMFGNDLYSSEMHTNNSTEEKKKENLLKRKQNEVA